MQDIFIILIILNFLEFGFFIIFIKEVLKMQYQYQFPEISHKLCCYFSHVMILEHGLLYFRQPD